MINAVTLPPPDAPAKRVDVSIVMPCLNEATTIAACVAEAVEALRQIELRLGLTGEIIVADNGSTDGSHDLARAAGARVVEVAERGYGAALRGGFAAAAGRFLVMGDSDLSYDFRESVPMITELEAGADFCMGSRFRGRIEPGAMPWKNRYIGNPVLSWILRVLFRTPISDSHCGLRAIRHEAYERLKLSSDGMEFASEMVLKAALHRLSIAEVPVTLRPDGRGRPPHLNPWRDGLRHLFYMLMLSPTWLFMGPSLALVLASLPILVVLIANPDGEMVRIGRFGVGDHWAVVAGAGLVIGTQTFVAGLAVFLLGIREGYMAAGPLAQKFFARSTLASWLSVGIVLLLAGLVWAGLIAAGWIQSSFGPLRELRALIGAATTTILGMQLVFGGFLLSVAAGNRLNHGAVLGSQGSR